MHAQVMYDASGVRLHAGRQASVLNMIITELPPDHPVSDTRPLRDTLGHTPLQVTGALCCIHWSAEIYHTIESPLGSWNRCCASFLFSCAWSAFQACAVVQIPWSSHAGLGQLAWLWRRWRLEPCWGWLWDTSWASPSCDAVSAELQSRSGVLLDAEVSRRTGVCSDWLRWGPRVG